MLRWLIPTENSIWPDWPNSETLSRPSCAQLLQLVLPQIKSFERRRLIQKRVPFIVPHRQMYLPMLLTDLRETFAPRIQGDVKTMSWVAQVVLLRHLLFHDVTECSLSRIAEMLGYTPMAISQAVGELVFLNICERLRLGREKRIRFCATPHELWRTALPHLRRPVKKAPEIAEFDEDAQAIVEVWAYSPKSLATGAAVDPLSLFLCFRDDSDERIQAALEQLVEEIE